MSHENVELARRLYAEGDLLHATTEQIDRVFREDLDENFEFRLPGDYPEGEPVFRGRDGVDQLAAMLIETWREWHFEPERFLTPATECSSSPDVGEGAASGSRWSWRPRTPGIRGGRATSMYAARARRMPSMPPDVALAALEE